MVISVAVEDKWLLDRFCSKLHDFSYFTLAPPFSARSCLTAAGNMAAVLAKRQNVTEMYMHGGDSSGHLDH